MWIAVSRQCRFMEEPLYLSSGLTRREAIRQYTIENAKILFLEKETGSLEPGKLADFIIVDRDPMTCPENQIRDVKVLETWLGGRKIWVRPTQAQN
jgi:predicted amidohydrolase YtcJ